MKARVNFLSVVLARVFAQAPKDNGFNRKRESCTQFSKIWRRNSQLRNNRQTSRQSKEEKVDFQVYRRKTKVKDNQLLYHILANASSIERTCKNGQFGTLCKSHIFFLVYLILEFLKIVPVSWNYLCVNWHSPWRDISFTLRHEDSSPARKVESLNKASLFQLKLKPSEYLQLY